MRLLKDSCQNMNHGRSNPPINFCPSCGEKLRSASSKNCDETKHASQRKDRGHYCYDCGKDLKK